MVRINAENNNKCPYCHKPMKYDVVLSKFICSNRKCWMKRGKNVNQLEEGETIGLAQVVEPAGQILQTSNKTILPIEYLPISMLKLGKKNSRNIIRHRFK